MFIVIAGGGKVGAALAHDLPPEGHEIVLLEKNRRKAQDLEDELGASVLPHDASEGRWLSMAGVARADLVIAVTGDDEDNGRAPSPASTTPRIKTPIACWGLRSSSMPRTSS